MKISIAFTSLLFLSLAFGVRAIPAQEQRAQNGAVKYLRADASLRQSFSLPTDAAAKLQMALESTLNDEDEKLVTAGAEALVEFQHGASSNQCDWSISAEDGALANTAHRGAILELASVSGLRARIRFRDGNTAGAITDLLAAMTAARHLSQDGSLASVLFAYKLENTLSVILAQSLFRLSEAQLKVLSDKVDALPRGFTLGKALLAEKIQRNDLLEIARDAKNRGELIIALLERFPILQSNRSLAIEIVQGCGDTVEGFLQCANRQQAFYSEQVTKFDLQPEQFERDYKTRLQEVSKGNSVMRQFTPNLARFRWAEAYCQTRRALLQAAIAVRLDGPDALDRYPDPYGGKPFSYSPLNKGFQLSSHLAENGSQLSLAVTIANSR
jgi:hypothetical protein